MNPLRVLLVDDNPDDRALAARELRKRFPEAQITQVFAADQFEAALKQGEVDVVITDYQLGWSNGIAVLQRVKASLADIPVIMFTGTAQQEDAVAAMKAGLDEFVVKSVRHFVRLPVAVEAVIQHGMQRRALRQSERLAVIGRLTSTVMHEIRNPLESVQGLLHLLGKDRNATDDIRHLAQSAEVQLSHIQEIIGRTLNLSRESAAPMSIDLGKITDDVLKFYTGRMELNRIEVARDYGVDCRVEGYAGETRQVISNVVANALDAMGRGGKLSVHIRRRQNDHRRGISYIVRDTGPGIPREHYARIFQPFFTTKGDKGTGLGLWIVDEIVRRRGGHIRLRTSMRAGRSGTCFRIFLPDTVTGANVTGLERTSGAHSAER
jgi:signal transduction histidine kinase